MTKEDKKILLSSLSYRGTLRFAGRDWVVVSYNDGEQAFYRSSGRNSGEKGTWFPVDGISENPWADNKLWFNKARFLWRGGDRFGNKRHLFIISLWLNEKNIPRGKLSKPREINEFINSKISLFYNESKVVSEWDGDLEEAENLK